MICLARVQEVERLLGLKTHSQRQIARLTGVSRASVGLIASGRRPVYEEEMGPDTFTVHRGPLARCPRCGGKVYLPCQLCRARDWSSALRSRSVG